MSGRILAREDYRLQITYRPTFLGHVLAIGFGAVLAGIVVFGWGL